MRLHRGSSNEERYRKEVALYIYLLSCTRCVERSVSNMPAVLTEPTSLREPQIIKIAPSASISGAVLGLEERLESHIIFQIIRQAMETRSH